MTRTKIVAGNWKMNGSIDANKALINDIQPLVESQIATVIVAPPSVYLSQVRELLKNSNIALAAQNVSEHKMGAYTGEVSVEMLKDFGVSYVILGHSERRSYYGETDSLVAQKVAAVLDAGLTPILCVGETLAEREAEATLKVCESQVSAVIKHVGVAAFKNIVIAYEPVWAIGTGLSATAQQAQDVHHAIRHYIGLQDQIVAEKVQILYGGSVKSSNSKELFSMPDIDGALVGGASLVIEEFVGIVKAAG
jgi:triosephosphate isomerase